VKPYPLDVLGAEGEGMIGYLLEQSFNSYCRSHRVMSDNGPQARLPGHDRVRKTRIHLVDASLESVNVTASPHHPAHLTIHTVGKLTYQESKL
jgi:hypothetical protein